MKRTAEEHEIQSEVQALRAEIERLNRAYYDEDQPLATDAEYDALMQRLRLLELSLPVAERQNSPSQRVGGQVKDGLQKGRHRYAMLSLLDVFSEAEVLSFLKESRERVAAESYVVEQKIDGLSLSLRYVGGELVQALTRGDGVQAGEDVTANARYVQGLPHKIQGAPEDLEVRAEVYLPYAAFEQVNEGLANAGQKLFANPRNAAAGSLRQADPRLVAERGLHAFVFNVQGTGDCPNPWQSHRDSLLQLETWGFAVSPDIFLCREDEAVLEALRLIEKKRSTLPYGIDGAVVKVDALNLRQELGETAKYPKWAVAYKYPPEERESRLLRIEVQVGRSGRITPLAEIEPILLAGTTVSRATLHNQSYIDALDVRVGDLVRVHKSGDIIPAILSVNLARRPEGTEAYHLPQQCPICSSPTEMREGHLYCPSDNCPAKLSRRLAYFFSKEAMDVEGLGPSRVDLLLEAGWVEDAADFYRLYLQRDLLVSWGKIGREKAVDKLLAEIEKSKKQPWERLLIALGIAQVGPQIARRLSRAFPSLSSLSEADENSLLQIPDVGPETCKNLLQYFEREENRQLLQNLHELGLNFNLQAESPAESLLSGLKVALTGRLSSLSRSEAKALLEGWGAHVSSSVSRQLDLLICGEDAGDKLKQARKLGVRIWHEREFGEFISNPKAWGQTVEEVEKDAD